MVHCVALGQLTGSNSDTLGPTDRTWRGLICSQQITSGKHSNTEHFDSSKQSFQLKPRKTDLIFDDVGRWRLMTALTKTEEIPTIFSRRRPFKTFAYRCTNGENQAKSLAFAITLIYGADRRRQKAICRLCYLGKADADTAGTINFESVSTVVVMATLQTRRCATTTEGVSARASETQTWRRRRLNGDGVFGVQQQLSRTHARSSFTCLSSNIVPQG